MDKAFSSTEAFARDLVDRVAKTAVEAGGAAAVVTFGGSGLNLANMTHVSTDGKIAVTVITAFLAAFASSVINTLRVFWKSPADRGQVRALLQDDLAAIENIVAKHAPGAAVVEGTLGSQIGAQIDKLTGTAPASQPLVTGTLAPSGSDEPEPGTVEATENADTVTADTVTDDDDATAETDAPEVSATQHTVVYDKDGDAIGYIDADGTYVPNPTVADDDAPVVQPDVATTSAPSTT